jgi:hypothetical protein
MSIPDIILQIKRGRGFKNLLIISFLILYGAVFFIFGILTTSQTNHPKPPVSIIYPDTVKQISELYPAKREVLTNTAAKQLTGNQSTINPTTATTPPTESSWGAVASKSGKVYYPIGCGSYTRIKEENRVYFIDEAEALSRGYSKSSLCK